MAIRVRIVLRFTFVGIHSWPAAPVANQEEYLRYPHRHTFYVEATKDVLHCERDIEIIAYQRILKNWCETFYAKPHYMSCESMANDLLERFELHSCRVLEDNENGAEVVRE